MADDRLDSLIVLTALGPLCVGMTAKGIAQLDLNGKTAGGSTPANALARDVIRLLQEYAAGKPVRFDLPLDLSVGTPFQQMVWQALRTIPTGQTRSYGWIAEQIGRPRATRAVGAACGANPVPIIVPCHRVITGDGTLGGFSSGLEWKKRLLALEGVADLPLLRSN